MKHPRDLFTQKFIKVWNRCDNIPDVVKAMGVSIFVVKKIAHNLRRKGIELRNYHHNPEVDYQALRALGKKTMPTSIKKNPLVEARESFYRDFIVVWQRAKSISEVERRFKMPRQRAKLVAARLRWRGDVPLKKFQKPNQVLDWEGLREAAIRLLEEIRDQKISRLVRYGTRHKREIKARGNR